MTDPDVTAALKKAVARGVDTHLFYDPKGSPRLPFGHPVRAGGLMHRKMCVIDEKQVLIGTANFTTPSLKMHQNVLIGLYSAEAAHHFARSADQKGAFSIGESRIESYFLPDFDGSALRHLIRWLDAAQKKIQVALFTFTHPQLVQSLTRAMQRGVEVTVALDQYVARGASRKVAAALAQAGVTILTSRGDALLHHKLAFIDEERLVVGSANWTKAAFTKNQDVLLFFDALGAVERKRLYKLWRAIENSAQKQSAPISGMSLCRFFQGRRSSQSGLISSSP